MFGRESVCAFERERTREREREWEAERGDEEVQRPLDLRSLQGYLAHEKPHPPRTLGQDKMGES